MIETKTIICPEHNIECTLQRGQISTPSTSDAGYIYSLTECSLLKKGYSCEGSCGLDSVFDDSSVSSS